MKSQGAQSDRYVHVPLASVQVVYIVIELSTSRGR